MTSSKAVQTGLERILKEKKFHSLLKGKRIGLAFHEASVDSNYGFAPDIFKKNSKAGRCVLTALFSPQHGFYGAEQDNMIETGHARRNDVPVWSLYSETRRPTEKMFRDVDAVVVDFQDIGCRIYTYMYTMSYLMEACAKAGKPVIVLDRPNPIGGEIVQGPALEKGQESFVGLYPMPVRHGMTMGELAQMMNGHWKLNAGTSCDLTVVPMKGWKRKYYWDETGLPFVKPSPNIPSPLSPVTFPGFVFYEGAQMSEARGTTRPLEQCGAPWMDPVAVMEHADREYPEWREGCLPRETAFRPMFQKHTNEPCRGIFIHPLKRKRFNPVVTGLGLMRAIREVHPKEFKWKQPPYEYENERLPIDVIAGGPFVREWVEGKHPWKALVQREAGDVKKFLNERRPWLLY